MNIKISIIVPIFNAEKFLHETLDSLKNQTLKDIQIICIDDGSTDSSPEILANYAAKDQRVRVFKQTNSGASAARNRGLDLANGEYVYFVDADDTIAPTLCEKAVRLAESNNLDFVFVFEKPAIAFGFERDTTFLNPGVTDKNRFLLNDTAALWQKVYSRQFLNKLGLRLDSALRVAEDQHFHFRAMVASRAFGVVAEELYHYRKHEGSLTRSAIANAKAFDIFSVHESIRNFLASQSRLQDFGDALLVQMLKQEFHLYCLLPRESLDFWNECFSRVISEHERVFLKTTMLPRLPRIFFLSITKGGTLAKITVWIIRNLLRSGRLLKRQLFI